MSSNAPFPPEEARDKGSPAGSAEPFPFLDMVLLPHRSLGAGGFFWLMAVLAGVSFLAGIAFVMMGAWPVFGFFGLDVALIYYAFRASYRSGGRAERLRIHDDRLEVIRELPNGVQRWAFNPYWVRVAIERPLEHDIRLVLSSHGRHLTIGGQLPPEERLEVAEALKDALARYRARHIPAPAGPVA